MRALLLLALVSACTLHVEMVVRTQPVARDVAVIPPASPGLVGSGGPCAVVSATTLGSEPPCDAATVRANCQSLGSDGGVCW